MTTAKRCRCRPTSCRQSTSTASDRCRTRGQTKAQAAELGEPPRRHEKNATARGEGGRSQGAAFQAGAASGRGSNPLTSRSSVGRRLRKCHWPGCHWPGYPSWLDAR
jgi:hypothetical protein